MRNDLVMARDRFEKIYRKLVCDLPLKPTVDRSMYRLALVSLLNAVPAWYRPGRLSVRDIASQIVLIFRASGLDTNKPSQPRKIRNTR